MTDIAAAVSFDRPNGLLANYLLLLADLWWVTNWMPASPLTVAIIVIAVGGIIALCFLALVGLRRGYLLDISWLRRLSGKRGVVQVLLEISTMASYCRGNRSAVASISIFSLASAATNMIVFFMLLIALGCSPSVAVKCPLLVPIVIEIACLPVSMTGWGLRENATQVIFSALSLDAKIALGASLASGVLGVLVGMVGGVVWFGDRQWNSIQTNSDTPSSEKTIVARKTTIP